MSRLADNNDSRRQEGRLYIIEHEVMMNRDCTPHDYIYQRELSFADTDAGGVGHFSRLLCLVEEAEHHFLRDAGIVVYSPDVQWPRVHVEVDYHKPAHAGETLTVALQLELIGHSSLTWSFVVSGAQGQVMTGKLVTVRLVHGQKALFDAEERERLSKI